MLEIKLENILEKEEGRWPSIWPRSPARARAQARRNGPTRPKVWEPTRDDGFAEKPMSFKVIVRLPCVLFLSVVALRPSP